MFRSISTFLVLLALALYSAGCSKGPGTNEQAVKNTNAGNSNQQDQALAAPPLIQATLKGDIERASFEISTARDAIKLGKWQDAVAQLSSARKEVDAALARQPRLREEFEALKAAIDQAIPAVQGREKGAESKVEELMTRIGAIKVNTFSR